MKNSNMFEVLFETVIFDLFVAVGGTALLAFIVVGLCTL